MCVLVRQVQSWVCCCERVPSIYRSHTHSPTHIIIGTWGIPCFTIPFCVVTMLMVLSSRRNDDDVESDVLNNDKTKRDEDGEEDACYVETC